MNHKDTKITKVFMYLNHEDHEGYYGFESEMSGANYFAHDHTVRRDHRDYEGFYAVLAPSP